jgi:hypothetical protein
LKSIVLIDKWYIYLLDDGNKILYSKCMLKGILYAFKIIFMREIIAIISLFVLWGLYYAYLHWDVISHEIYTNLYNTIFFIRSFFEKPHDGVGVLGMKNTNYIKIAFHFNVNGVNK